MSKFQSVLIEVRNQLISDKFPKTPYDINCGFCADFATLVWEKMNRDQSILIHNDEEMMPEQEYSHTFLEYENLFYDAECLEGVDDWTDLPTFHR